MESNKSKRNREFMDAVTLDGRRPQLGVGTSSYWHNPRTNTEGVTTRFRSGSVTETHMHGGAMGTATHTNRYGETHTLTGGKMNSDTKEFVRARHGY